MLSKTLVFILLTISLHAEDPWGKDADLVYIAPKPCSTPPKDSPMQGFTKNLIRFHQEVISPADGPRSNYIPSSSQYAMDAVQQYGFIAGVGMGCDRLMRENDEEWVYGVIQSPDGTWMKYDPVR